MSCKVFIYAVLLAQVYCASCYIVRTLRLPQEDTKVQHPAKAKPLEKDASEECSGPACAISPMKYEIHDLDEFVEKFNQKTLVIKNGTYTGEDDCGAESGYVSLNVLPKDPKESKRRIRKHEDIWYEKCNLRGEQCFNKAKIIGAVRAQCVQEYHEIIVKTPLKKYPQRVMLKIPKCCSCKLIKNEEIMK